MSMQSPVRAASSVTIQIACMHPTDVRCVHRVRHAEMVTAWFISTSGTVCCSAPSLEVWNAAVPPCNAPGYTSP